jgi:hypothetical protein
MAIIYSYPHATPTINDMVLGARFIENEGISTNSFYISDLVTVISEQIPVIQGLPGEQGPPGTTGSPGIQGVPGEQGIQGLAGEVGPAGLEWEGAWNKFNSYVEDDAVSFGGASYFCILAIEGSTLNGNPTVDTTHWALLAAQGAPGLQGIQGIPGIQGPPGTQGIQGIQGIQGVPGTAATQTLQQTVDLGNTISGIAGGVTFTTTLTNLSVKIGGSSISGMTLNTTQLICEKNSGSDLMVLQFPTVYSGINQITLPSATGTVALIGNITLQQAMIGGNTITDGFNTMTVTANSIKTNNSLGGQIELVGGISTAKPYIKFGLPSSAGKTVTLTHADVQSESRVIKLPDNNGTIALTTDITTPTLQEVTDAGANAYGNTVNLKNSSISDGTIEFNVDDFFEPFIKVENLGAGSAGHFTKIGSSTIEFDGDTDYNTILEAGVGSNNTITLPSESGTLALVNYKVYTALLTQTGTNAPVATVLENTLGVTPVWSYLGAGFYLTDYVLGTNVNKIYYSITNKPGVANEFRIAQAQDGPDFGISVYTYASGVAANGIMTGVPIEIRVYN